MEGDSPIHVQRALCNKRNVQRGAPDRAQRVSHDAIRRRSSKTRKTVRFTTDWFLCAVRAPLDRDERTRQRGQRPRACWCERKALWGPDFGVGAGDECGRAGV
jgi:hypothetical protein